MSGGDPGGLSWLLISISAGPDASLRVAVWRQLRKLGAMYLQSSVCLLPDLPPVAETVNQLVARVRDSGGQARVLHVQLDVMDAEAIVAEQRGERDSEYAEFVDRTPAFRDEIRSETERGRSTYTEVEESEADLARFDRWLESITARDYFGATGYQAARAALEACRDALTRFEAAALVVDNAAFAVPTTRRPRALKKA